MSLKLRRNQPWWCLFVHFSDVLVLKPLLEDPTKKTLLSTISSFTSIASSSCWSLTTVKSPTAFAEKTPSRYSSIVWLALVAKIVIKATEGIHQNNFIKFLKSWIYQAKRQHLRHLTALPEKLCGMCGPLPKTFTIFMTKICDLP